MASKSGRSRKNVATLLPPARNLHSVAEDELNIINVLSLQLLQEAAQVDDLTQAVAISLHGRNIVKIQALELCTNLRTLDLSFNMIKRLDGLETLTKLKELKIYDNQILSLSGISALTQLHTLDISGNKLTSLQGLAGLRTLRVLRCAHNKGLENLEGLGRANAIESLDVSFCALPDLSNLSAAVALTELVADGNKLVNLKGLQRCDQLVELRVAHNQLSTLQGLRHCAKTLDALDVRGNRLSNLDGLAEGMTQLHELYASENHLTSLAGLPEKVPALETLDVSANKLYWRPGGCPQLVSELSQLPELSWVALSGNPGCPPGYQVALLAGITTLDGVDDLGRPQLPSRADVWVNEGAQGSGDEVVQLLTGPVEAEQLLPTVSEMEQYKADMGILTEVPTMGLQLPPSKHQRPSSAARTHTPSVRPSSAARMALSSRGGVPGGGGGGGAGSCPSSALGRPRPGTASSVGLSGAPVKDILMHIPVPSARTGSGARLMTPDQYTQAVAEFGTTMAHYSSNLRSTLTAMKAGLQLTMSDLAKQVRTPEGQAARELPVMPVVPAMPTDMVRERVMPQQAGVSSKQVVGLAQQREQQEAKRNALRDPGAATALDLYARLYPQPLQPPRKGQLRPGSVASGVLQAGQTAHDSGQDSSDEELAAADGPAARHPGLSAAAAVATRTATLLPMQPAAQHDLDDDRDELIRCSSSSDGSSDGEADEYLLKDDCSAPGPDEALTFKPGPQSEPSADQQSGTAQTPAISHACADDSTSRQRQVAMGISDIPGGVPTAADRNSTASPASSSQAMSGGAQQARSSQGVGHGRGGLERRLSFGRGAAGAVAVPTAVGTGLTKPHGKTRGVTGALGRTPQQQTLKARLPGTHSRH